MRGGIIFDPVQNKEELLLVVYLSLLVHRNFSSILVLSAFGSFSTCSIFRFWSSSNNSRWIKSEPTRRWNWKFREKYFLKSGWRTWCFSHFFHDCGLAKSQPLPLAILDSKIAKVKNYYLNVTKVHHPDVKNIFPQFHRRDPTVNQKRKCMHMRHVTTSFIFWNGSKVLPSPRFEQNYTAFRA